MQPPLQAIRNYLTGTASEAEQQLVHDWYHSFNDELIELPAETEALREVMRNRIHERLLQTIRQTSPGQLPVYQVNARRRWLAAAVWLGVMAIGAYWFVHLRPGPPVAVIKTQPEKRILPGGNKAMLTLADGSVIVLDSTREGLLARQGDTKIVQSAAGRLNYQAGATTEKLAYNTISTPVGGQYQVVLPDGTRVWLNSASSLQFPVSFTGNAREVILKGEAYFEVTHLSSGKVHPVPFTVLVNSASVAGDMKVTVLGTKFNVMAYQDEEAVQTSLLEGMVKASNKVGNRLIRPGMQAVLNRNEANFTLDAADMQQVLAWKNGEFRFREVNIKQIMRQLARWYDMEVEYRGNLDNIRLSGVVPKKEEASQLLEVLQTTGKVRFVQKGNKVTVLPG